MEFEYQLRFLHFPTSSQQECYFCPRNILMAALHLVCTYSWLGFPGGSAVKNLPAMQEMYRRRVFHPFVRRSPGGGYGYPIQYSCLENPMDRGAWWATVHEVEKESDMTKWLNNNKSSGWYPSTSKIQSETFRCFSNRILVLTAYTPGAIPTLWSLAL